MAIAQVELEHASSFGGFIELARRSLEEENGMSLSTYDSSFIVAADILPPDRQNEMIGKILNSRNDFNVWGISAPPHDAVVTTLAVIWGLSRAGVAMHNLEGVEGGLNFLIHSCMEYPYHQTVAFEGLAYSMLQEIKKTTNINVEPELEGYLEKLYNKFLPKVNLIRDHLGFYNPGHSLSFTSELALFLPDFSMEEASQADKAILPNGSIGLSPAAGAGTIRLLKDRGLPVNPRLTESLLLTLENYDFEGAPGVDPYENMKYLWYALPWMLTGDIDKIAQTPEGLELLVQMYKRTSIDEKGRASWDPNNQQIPDLDDTANAFRLYLTLKKAGVRDIKPISVNTLNHFKNAEGKFFCFPMETHSSPGPIMHALDAIDMASDIYGDTADIKEIREALLSQIGEFLQEMNSELISKNGNVEEFIMHICHDKWHSTWTYLFKRWVSIRSLVRRFPKVALNLAEFAIHSQRFGGWGQNTASLEETAYVVSGLSKFIELIDREDTIFAGKHFKGELEDCIKNAAKFMQKKLEEDEPQPNLWIAKTLYRPHWVDSAIENALYRISKHAN